MRESSEQNPRNIRDRPVVGQATPYPSLVGDYLRDRFSPLRHAEKLLARAARVSPRTAENWLRGECAPNGEALVNLIGECEGLAEVILAEAERRRAVRA
jgi:hypothetical protein